jgi:Phage protein Gp19/Gp15/Gp42
MESYATVNDLIPERFPRALTATETAQVGTMFEDASFLLSIHAPGLQAAIDGGDEQITYAAMLLTVAMVKRALIAQAAQVTASPMADQITEAWGPYSQSIKYKTDNGNLFLYDSELDWLLGLLRGDVAEAVSVRSPGF